MSNLSKNGFEESKVIFPEAERALALADTDGRPFKSATIGITMPLPNYNVKRDVSKTNVFEYVVEGEGEVFINNKWHTVSANDFYILRQDEPHHYRASKKNPWKKLWINYVADYIAPFMDSYGVLSGVYKADGIEMHFNKLLQIAEDRIVNDGIYFTIADNVHEIIKKASLRQGTAVIDEYGIKQRIHSHVYGQLSLENLADEMHMSKSNLIRIFKKNYGTTPYEYLLYLKIETAKLLLRESALSISEISKKLCIFDEHYFSQLFFKKTGIRPSSYRLKYRK